MYLVAVIGLAPADDCVASPMIHHGGVQVANGGNLAQIESIRVGIADHPALHHHGRAADLTAASIQYGPEPFPVRTSDTESCL